MILIRCINLVFNIKIIDYTKTKSSLNIFLLFIIIDEFADDASYTRPSQILLFVYVRGRYILISAIVAIRNHAIQPIIRFNASELCIYRLSNNEVSVVVDNKTLI